MLQQMVILSSFRYFHYVYWGVYTYFCKGTNRQSALKNEYNHNK